MTKTYALAAGVALAALLAGSGYYVWRAQTADQFADCRSTRVAGGTELLGGPFTLVSETGETVTDADVLTVPSLVYFGYTYCPDVCPLDNLRNAEATYLLDEQGIEIQPVFISVDPARDTPQAMADFTDAMHPRMLGLTGTEEQVDVAAKAYRVYYNRQEPAEGEEEYYLVDHMTFTYLVLPGHGTVEAFPRETRPEEMAEKIACFVENV